MLVRREVEAPGDAPPWVIVLAEDDLCSDIPDSPTRATGPRRRPLLEPTAASSLLATVDGAEFALFEGVLHDRADIVDRLGRRALRGVSDADLIHEAYRAWGADFVRRIKGTYAVVVWDAESDELIAARDRIGLHPLFYAATGRALLLSNSIDALARHPIVSAQVNRPALADRLCHRWPFLDETYFTNVKRIPSGHALRRRGDALTVVRYWAPALDSATDWVTEHDVGRFDDLLDRAVGRTLDRGAPAIYLSGGLDSVTVAAIAADSCRNRGWAPPLALSLLFPEPESEEDAQRRIALDLGLPHFLATVSAAAGPGGLVQAALRMSAASPSPLLNLWAPAYEHLSLEAKSRGAQTVLTGSGGDEWLTVALDYAADLLAAAKIAELWRFLTNRHRSYRLSPWTLLRLVLWTYGVRPLIRPPVARAVAAMAPGLLATRRRHLLSRLTPPWVAPEPALQRQLLERYERRLEADRREKARGPQSHYGSVLNRMFDSPVVALGLEEFFECGRRTGLSLVHPFWDADLVEFLYRVPPRLLDQGGRSKGLVRQSLARRFPELGFEQQRKLYADGLFNSVLMTEGMQAWRRMGRLDALAQLGLAKGDGLTDRVERLISRGGAADVFNLWHLLSVEAWLQSHA